MQKEHDEQEATEVHAMKVELKDDARVELKEDLKDEDPMDEVVLKDTARGKADVPGVMRSVHKVQGNPQLCCASKLIVVCPAGG